MSQMPEIRFTLLADGSSDRVLLDHLTWLLAQHTSRAVAPAWADLSHVAQPKRSLAQRIALAIDLYTCDVLFVHRDAEGQSRSMRVAEIRRACGTMSVPGPVCVVPMRMQEAWLLFDEAAIRRAAGNPHGRMPLALPRIATLEAIANPKARLHELLSTASGLSGRRLKDFSPHRIAWLVGRNIADFSPLRALPAFKALEDDIVDVAARCGW